MLADLRFKVGWVFGSVALLGLVFTFFVLPETKVSFLNFLREYAIIWENLFLTNVPCPRDAHSRKQMQYSLCRIIHFA
jgi:hypothetical protein